MPEKWPPFLDFAPPIEKFPFLQNGYEHGIRLGRVWGSRAQNSWKHKKQAIFVIHSLYSPAR